MFDLRNFGLKSDDSTQFGGSNKQRFEIGSIFVICYKTKTQLQDYIYGDKEGSLGVWYQVLIGNVVYMLH